MPRVKTKRLDAEAWIEAATTALANSGLHAVAVEALARDLGVTKGSFYWHFKNRDALLSAVLERWERRYTDRSLSRFEEVSDPRERLIFVFGEATRLDEGDQVHLALAPHTSHPLVAPYVQRNNRRRIAYLENCLRDLGFEAEPAQHRAVLIYTAYLGLMHLRVESPAELPPTQSFHAYLGHVLETLVPSSA